MPWWAIVLIVANTLGLVGLGAFVIWMFGRANKAYYLSMSLEETINRRKDFWDKTAPTLHSKMWEVGERVRKLEDANAQQSMGRAPD